MLREGRILKYQKTWLHLNLSRKTDFLTVGDSHSSWIQVINVFCLINDVFQQHFPSPLRTRGYEPTLSDSEVITIEIVGEWLGHDKD